METNPTVWVTPTLILGEVPTHLDDVYRTENAAEALLLIRDGLTAVLPAGDWETAEQVLRVLNPYHDSVLERIQMAKTGRYQRIQCKCPSCLAWVTRRRREPNGALIFYDEGP
jgi:hypothetical protein